jgi:HPt (histidine-containing phosphotransfer) domain-containing protein
VAENARRELSAGLQGRIAAVGERFRESVAGACAELAADVHGLAPGLEPADRDARLRRIEQDAHRLAGAAGIFGHGILGSHAAALEARARELRAGGSDDADGLRAAIAGLLESAATLR